MKDTVQAIVVTFASRKFVIALLSFVVFAQAGEYEKAWAIAGGYLGLQGLIDHKATSAPAADDGPASLF